VGQGLIDSIGEGPVALDSSVLIYLIELHPRYAPILWPLFETIQAGELLAVTSTLTLLETLVVPYRQDDLTLADRYEAILTAGEGLTLVPIDLQLLRSAARIRAATSVRTADALHLATAIVTRCTTFLTNDRRLPSFPGLAVLQLDDFTSASA
jgi:predicted nucleic acid-binding protein